MGKKKSLGANDPIGNLLRKFWIWALLIFLKKKKKGINKDGCFFKRLVMLEPICRRTINKVENDATR